MELTKVMVKINMEGEVPPPKLMKAIRKLLPGKSVMVLLHWEEERYS